MKSKLIQQGYLWPILLKAFYDKFKCCPGAIETFSKIADKILSQLNWFPNVSITGINLNELALISKHDAKSKDTHISVPKNEIKLGQFLDLGNNNLIVLPTYLERSVLEWHEITSSTIVVKFLYEVYIKNGLTGVLKSLIWMKLISFCVKKTWPLWMWTFSRRTSNLWRI